ncbi:aspartate aminotransferase family protein [Methylocella sp.]|jgi:ornithine--oxo-acid transaminase|uniref:aspartate aminotransferase family protein n=1 Tax=Methylocella sp. TaxID=1978226 RepID=UPI003C225F17
MKTLPFPELKADRSQRRFDIRALIAAREGERYSLNAKHLNEMMVRVFQTIGRGVGQYLYDRHGARYLDLLSGWGVFGIGRNHPLLRETLNGVLAADLPNLAQMDASLLAGLLAERLLGFTHWLDKVFFANSGTEAVEAAVKFARRATGRPEIVYCSDAFHGLTYGALSMNGDAVFKEGFEPLAPGFTEIPFNDPAALERALAAGRAAAFIVEPIQGKGVNMPDESYLADAARLCRKYGALFIADEIQTGMGRTGRFLAVEHGDVEPDMVLLSKALSGGHAPVGAVLTRKHIFDKVFDRMDRAVVHGSTFARNDLAMAAGLATLEVMESERLIANAARTGARLLKSFEAMAQRYQLVKAVRGRGLMIGVEFGNPQSLKLKAAWSLVEAVNAGLFCQLITIPLFKEHNILVQVAGHANHTIKLLPALVIDESDCGWIERAFDAVIADSHRVPGAVWSLGRTLADHALKARASK